MWWDSSQQQDKKIFENQITQTWIRSDKSATEKDSALSERATQSINKEVSRYLSLMAAEILPSSSSVWLKKGIDL